jgi:hypothetical protein
MVPALRFSRKWWENFSAVRPKEAISKVEVADFLKGKELRKKGKRAKSTKIGKRILRLNESAPLRPRRGAMEIALALFKDKGFSSGTESIENYLTE